MSKLSLNTMKTFNLNQDPKIGSGFSVPEDYFENFSERIRTRIPSKKKQVVSIFRRNRTQIFGAAALILGMALPTYIILSNKTKEVDDVTLENYLSYNARISESELTNLLDEKDFLKMSIDLKLDDKTLENELSKNPNLEQYLIN